MAVGKFRFPASLNVISSVRFTNSKTKERTGEYHGSWKFGKMDGFGNLSFGKMSMYSGDFKNGKRHGQGYMKNAIGDEYQGSILWMPLS